MVAKTKRAEGPARWLRWLAVVGLLLSSGWAMAADQCPALLGRQADP